MMRRCVGVFALLGVHVCVPAQTIYRCGNAYTNQPADGGNCKPLAGGQVTVIEGLRVNPHANAAVSPASAVKIDKTEQQQRDAQAAVVLQNELQHAQARHAHLLREWNQGEPERLPDERRQPEKYQARVQSLKASLQRSEADIAGLQRELARFNATPGK